MNVGSKLEKEMSLEIKSVLNNTKLITGGTGGKFSVHFSNVFGMEFVLPHYYAIRIRKKSFYFFFQTYKLETW